MAYIKGNMVVFPYLVSVCQKLHTVIQDSEVSFKKKKKVNKKIRTNKFKNVIDWEIL